MKKSSIIFVKSLLIAAYKEVDQLAKDNINAAIYGLDCLLFNDNQVMPYLLDDLKVLYEYNKTNEKIKKAHELMIKIILKEKEHEDSICW